MYLEHIGKSQGIQVNHVDEVKGDFKKGEWSNCDTY